MKICHSGLAAVVLAAAFVLPGTFPANQASAAPIFVPKAATAQSDVIRVRDGWYRGNRGYYRRGYRNYNGGYRNNNDWWYPAGAFVAGALIGGAIANNNYGGYYGNRYYDDRYYAPRYYTPRYYAPSRVYYPPRGTAYRQGYRDGFRDGANARYDDITCTQRLSDAGKC